MRRKSLFSPLSELIHACTHDGTDAVWQSRRAGKAMCGPHGALETSGTRWDADHADPGAPGLADLEQCDPGAPGEALLANPPQANGLTSPALLATTILNSSSLCRIFRNLLNSLSSTFSLFERRRSPIFPASTLRRARILATPRCGEGFQKCRTAHFPRISRNYVRRKREKVELRPCTSSRNAGCATFGGCILRRRIRCGLGSGA
jgi:hypothetical protein